MVTIGNFKDLCYDWLNGIGNFKTFGVTGPILLEISKTFGMTDP